MNGLNRDNTRIVPPDIKIPHFRTTNPKRTQNPQISVEIGLVILGNTKVDTWTTWKCYLSLIWFAGRQAESPLLWVTFMEYVTGIRRVVVFPSDLFLIFWSYFEHNLMISFVHFAELDENINFVKNYAHRTLVLRSAHVKIFLQIGFFFFFW